ncbi:hypothetical protein CkaCkLH20_02124 [Colletotrichum karsti]|uniref:Siroheme synthase n=1 Tax=Colletotrichum karsti TaxID=1095194 RepID=A0A9P6LNY2_9PEZI|nr:uncharacterized protein CkaCkLH20_02124 [Colletotrichum karsti]KAF9880170.1 hypothetical protein CkaCkLH20_02124 [Colletotrichum karsti]
MPPRRRNAAAEPEPEPEAHQPSDTEYDRTSPGSFEEYDPVPQFFGTTFTTHRVSPLYIGAGALKTTRLTTLSQRLRDTLVGDVVRGVQVGLEGNDSSVGRLGSLEKVRFRWVGVDALLGGAEDPEADVSRDLRSDSVGGGISSTKRALVLEMSYENGFCSAVLLPSSTEKRPEASDVIQPTNLLNVPGSLAGTTSTDDGHFLHLPLLLLRMPTPLKVVIIDFLSSVFDCRISPMRLGTKFLAAAWERWIEDAGLPSEGPLAKDLVLTLGFYIPPAALEDGENDLPAEGLGIKSIEVVILADDLERFAKEGRTPANDTTTKRKAFTQGYENDARKRKRLAGGKSDEGWGWRHDGNQQDQQLFLNAVGTYLDKHLALNLFHPGVRITKVSCGGFVLAEGRFRLHTPPGDEDEVFEPARNLVESLVASAAS